MRHFHHIQQVLSKIVFENHCVILYQAYNLQTVASDKNVKISFPNLYIFLYKT